MNGEVTVYSIRLEAVCVVKSGDRGQDWWKLVVQYLVQYSTVLYSKIQVQVVQKILSATKMKRCDQMRVFPTCKKLGLSSTCLCQPQMTRVQQKMILGGILWETTWITTCNVWASYAYIVAASRKRRVATVPGKPTPDEPTMFVTLRTAESQLERNAFP